MWRRTQVQGAICIINNTKVPRVGIKRGSAIRSSLLTQASPHAKRTQVQGALCTINNNKVPRVGVKRGSAIRSSLLTQASLASFL